MALNYSPQRFFPFRYNVGYRSTSEISYRPRYREVGLISVGYLFAMARGYQGEHGDVKALAMKKWFHTNYHYIVPELEDDTEICLCGTKAFDEYLEAKELGIETKPVILGAFTLLKLLKFSGSKTQEDVIDDLSLHIWIL